ncbi:MAG: caspase family protein [Parcubacteria group bacterium]|jgi:hypothetical protein
MKKILTTILIATFFISIGITNAQDKVDIKSKATNIKIKMKKPISDEERKKIEENFPKGKPAVSVDTTTKFIFPATGINVSSLGRKYAIVVGMANYPGMDYDLCVTDAKTNLSNPLDGLAKYCKDDDSWHMYSTLINEYQFDKENVVLLADKNATYTNIKNAIDDLMITKGLTADDEIVFFFSGHGMAGNYLGEGTDTDADNVDEAFAFYDETYPSDVDIIANPEILADYNYLVSNSMIFDDELKSLFANSPTDRITFVFDICGAGGMNDLAQAGRVIVMSSKENESSYTFYLGGTYTSLTTIQESQGLFSHYFVNNGMEDGLADGYNLLSRKDIRKYDGLVSIEEAFGYAYPIVKSIKPQTPTLSDGLLNDFLP